MKNNLPEIKKENIFSKIKNWFRSLFHKEEVLIEPVVDVTEEINKKIEAIMKQDFKENLQVYSKDRILSLQRKLKEKQMEMSELTDEELDEMIELYKQQIEDKKKILKQYRNKLSN